MVAAAAIKAISAQNAAANVKEDVRYAAAGATGIATGAQNAAMILIVIMNARNVIGVSN